MTSLDQALESLVGLSIGDAFGQCFFSLSQDDGARVLAGDFLPDAPWYYTDDTEMSLSVVASLSRFGHIDQAFLAKSFADHYSYDRAYGPAMHRALASIRAGEDWTTVSRGLFSGQGSYGNGSAMRSAPLGAYFAGQHDALVSNAAKAAEITHSHPEGIAGAIAVAAAAGTAIEMRQAGQAPDHVTFLDRVIALVPDSEVRALLGKARAMSSVSSLHFPASILGNGTDMSAQDTVPYALWCCAQSLHDYEQAVWLGLHGGVDRDTIGAIIGGVVVCYSGLEEIPASWALRREQLPGWPSLLLRQSWRARR